MTARLGGTLGVRTDRACVSVREPPKGENYAASRGSLGEGPRASVRTPGLDEAEQSVAAGDRGCNGREFEASPGSRRQARRRGAPCQHLGETRRWQQRGARNNPDIHMVLGSSVGAVSARSLWSSLPNAWSNAVRSGTSGHMRCAPRDMVRHRRQQREIPRAEVVVDGIIS